MHRHMRRVGDQRAVVREHRAGEIEPLLDVDRIGGVLQRHAHLLGDRHEQVVEHFQHHRVGMGADGMHALEWLDAREHQMVLARQLRLPAGLYDDGLVRLDDDGGAFHFMTRLELVAGKDRGLVPFAAGEELRPPRRFRQGGAGRPAGLLAELGAAADGFHRHGFDHQLFGAVDEAELRLVRVLEGALHLGERCALDLFAGQRAGIDHQRRIGPRIADVRAHDHLDLARRDALARDLVACLLADALGGAFQRLQRLGAERLLDRLLASGADIGEAHAVGRQQRRERVDEHARHAERVGDETGVLTAGAAEAVERVARHVIAALHRNLLDRVRHVLDGDLDEAVGDLFR